MELCPDRSQQGERLRSMGRQPTNSTLHSLHGQAERDDADWIIDDGEITICIKEDGSEFLLGRGAFGKVLHMAARL